jgi:quercetin dioxygenase-like cupin family protein
MQHDNPARLREHPAERFAAPEHQFDLAAVAAQLRKEPLLPNHQHRQITLYHHDLMTVVLFVFEQDGELIDHQANGVVTIHLLEGEVQVKTDAQTHDLAAASLVALAPTVRHSVTAKRPSVMLLTVSLEPAEDANG